MKIKHILLLLILSLSSAKAGISLFDINTSQYPKMSAKAFFLDDNGENIPGLNKSDILIDENGIIREVTSLQCPVPKPPAPLSAVLTIDVSGSMSGSGIVMAQSAAKVFVNSIPLGKSEVAVTSFDSDNYLNCDFTKNKDKLLAAIDALRPQGGTDFDAGLIKKMFGSLILAEKGHNKRVVIFLTDGYSSGNESAIINQAKQLNTVIYCVVLGQKAPVILQNIAKQTGGQCFENIRTVEDAENCYKDILHKAQGGDPCTITWNSAGCPDNRKVTLALPSRSLSTYDYYSVDFSLLPQLVILPGESIRFGGLAPGTLAKQPIKIKCARDVIKIDSITSSNPQFKLIGFPAGGRTLNPNEDLDLTVQFLPFDSAYKFSRFTIHSNACTGNFFYASGGFHGAKKTLEVLTPNGKESFIAGVDTTITWKGVPETDSVKIELSVDGGITWKMITSQGVGLSKSFTPPNVQSDKCLVRIKQLESMGAKQSSFRVHTFTAKSLSISPDSKLIATSGEERNFNVFDISTGKLVKNVSSGSVIKKVRFSPDGQLLAASLGDYSIELYSTSNWSLARKINGNNTWIDDFVFSADSKFFATTSDDKNNHRVRLFDLVNNKTYYSNSAHNGQINKVISSRDGTRIISTANDGMIKIWDVKTGNEIRSISGATSFDAIDLSSEGERISVTANNNKQLMTFDLNSGSKLNEIKLAAENDKYSDVAYSPDGQTLALSTTRGYIHFYSAESYDSVRSIRPNTFIINDIEWSANSQYLASITNEGNLHTINFEILLQDDISDDYFSIIKPTFTQQDVSFPAQRLSTMKDSTFAQAFTNTSTVPIYIKNAKFIGDSSGFQVVSYRDTIAGNASANLELRFLPTVAKAYSSTVRIYTQSDSADIRVSGVGYAPFFAEYNKYLDFGKVGLEEPKDTLFTVFKNNSNKDVTITKISIRGTEENAFILSNYNKIVAVGKELSLPIRFAPSERGLVNTLINIYTDSEAQPIPLQVFGEGISNCGAYSFSKERATQLKEVTLMDDAQFADSVLALNKAKSQSMGGIILKNIIPIDSGFSMSFKFSIGEPFQYSKEEHSYPGADGMSILFHNSDRNRGTGGGRLGYSGVRNALAIELDLFANDNRQIENYFDPNGNHLAVFRVAPGDTALISNHKADNVLAVNPDILEVRSDNTPYYLKVDYVPQSRQLFIYLDSTGEFKSPAIKLDNFNFSDYIDLYDKRGAFISILGVSGSSYQMHKLHSLKLCTHINATPVYNSVEFSEIAQLFNIYYNSTAKSLELINLDDDNMHEQASISIVNAPGEEVLANNYTIGKNLSLPLNGLASGIYIVEIRMNSGKTQNFKFAIE